jgi:hypothetical protein
MVNAAGGQFLQTFRLDAENCLAIHPASYSELVKICFKPVQG